MTENPQMKSTITVLLLCIMNVFTGAGFSSTSTSIIDTFLLKIVCNDSVFSVNPHNIETMFPDTFEIEYQKFGAHAVNKSLLRYSIEALFSKDSAGNYSMTDLFIDFKASDKSQMEKYFGIMRKSIQSEPVESEYPNGKFYSWSKGKDKHVFFVATQEEAGSYSIRVTATTHLAEPDY